MKIDDMPWLDVAALAATARLGDFAELATAIIAGCALVGAVVQLRQARKTTLETRAHQYLERYGAPQLIPYRVKAHVLIGSEASSADEDRLVATWEQMSFGDKQRVLVVMNFWEELAGMYNRKLVDRQIIYEYFGDVVHEFWMRSDWLRRHLQGAPEHVESQLRDGHVYNELEEMRKDFANRDRGERGRLRVLSR